ncbi:hypothetical protein BH11BAC7_BH11BAC7_15030 [soil metagenome]
MSERPNIILTESILSMLGEIETVFKKNGVDYYFAGAFARDLHFSAKRIDKQFRRTNDIDIAICLNDEGQFQKIVRDLTSTGSFVQIDNEPIKFIFKSQIEIDLIPFGKIETENRETVLTKPMAFVLQMPGFSEAYQFIEELKINGLVMKTCPLEGLVLLKLISHNDRSHRTKDITDIENIIDVYFDWNSEEIFSNHNDLFEEYDVKDLDFYLPMIAAHVIGRKMNKILENSTGLRKRIISILKKRDDPRWKAMKNAFI